jgi:hypothetical protein
MALVTADQSKVGEMMMNLLEDPIRLAKMKAAQLELKNNITMDPIERFIFGNVVAKAKQNQNLNQNLNQNRYQSELQNPLQIQLPTNDEKQFTDCINKLAI